MQNRLSDRQWRELAPLLQVRRLAKGEFLFRADDEADGVYLIRSGRLGVQVGTGFEGRMQVVALLEAGAPVGEKGVALQGRRKMSVVAIEETVVDYLPAGDFAAIEQANPQLAIAVLKGLLDITSLRLRAGSERLAHVL